MVFMEVACEDIHSFLRGQELRNDARRIQPVIEHQQALPRFKGKSAVEDISQFHELIDFRSRGTNGPPACLRYGKDKQKTIHFRMCDGEKERPQPVRPSPQGGRSVPPVPEEKFADVRK